jgi:hypothetical protein
MAAEIFVLDRPIAASAVTSAEITACSAVTRLAACAQTTERRRR